MISKTFAGALALAFAATPVAALEQSHNGAGQAVLLPYYSVNNGLSTVFAVTNHADAAKAVRVVIAEGRNGRVALSFNVYLAARDTWGGAIVDDPAAAPRVFTVDSSCTSAAFPIAGVPLRPFAWTGTREDGLGREIDRAREGQIELIELGTLIDSAAQITEAENCLALRQRFETGNVWDTDINADITAPSGGISGEAQLIDVVGGVAFNTEPFVIDGFSKAARHENGSIDYRDVRIFKPTGTNGNNEFVIGAARIPAQRPADAISLMMMAAELEGAYTISDAVDASTHFVLSFPTRAAYLDNLPGGELPPGTPAVQPFAPLHMPFGTEPPYCVLTNWRSIDRDGDFGTTAGLSMCEQVNVVRIRDEFEQQSEVNDFVVQADQGRVRVGLGADLHTLVYSTGPLTDNGFLYGLPALAHSLMEVRNYNAQPGRLAGYAISGRIVRKQDGMIDF